MSASSERPNVMLIMADQMTPFLTGVYGHPVVQTPNLDRLAERGVRFDAAYSPCPLCAPARASLMTGRHASRIRAYDNATPLAVDEPTIAHYLTNAGYDTISSGKLHYVGADQCHGFRRRLTTDVYPSMFNWLPTDQRSKGERVIERRQHAHNYALPRVGVGEWTQFLNYDDETQFRAVEYLRSRVSRRGGNDPGPFFLSVSFHCPHDPFRVPQRYWDIYEGAPIQIPDYPEDMEDTYSTMDRWLNAYHGTDRIDIKGAESLTSLRRAYYGLITYIDDKVGELMRVLEETGTAENTFIVFTSDHGDMLAEKNMVQKRSFYEWSSRVPMLLSWPDASHAGTVCDEPASLIDLLPTILDVTGIDERLPMDGQSLVPCVAGDEEGRVAFSEFHANGVYATCFMVRKGGHKYVYINGEDNVQLFDLNADPGEWRNLAGQPEHAALESELRSRLLAEFDPDAIERDVQKSLTTRKLIKEAMERNDVHWDHTPDFDATKQYVR